MQKLILFAGISFVFCFSTCGPLFISYKIQDNKVAGQSPNETYLLDKRLAVHCDVVFSHFPSGNIKPSVNIHLKNRSVDTIIFNGDFMKFESDQNLIDTAQVNRMFTSLNREFLLPGDSLLINRYYNVATFKGKLGELKSKMSHDNLRLKIFVVDPVRKASKVDSVKLVVI